MQILGRDADPETVKGSATIGFDRPLYVQYGDWFAHALRGTWDGPCATAPVRQACGTGCCPPAS